MNSKYVQNVEFSVPKKELFNGVLDALSRIKELKIEGADESSGNIIVKTGMSLRSWGECITVLVTDASSGNSRVSITSEAKHGTDMGRGQKNIREIIDGTSKILGQPLQVQEPHIVGDTSKNIVKILQRRGISSEEVIIASEGSNGQIILTNKGVIIGREGLGNKILVGYTKGEKFLPYRNIAGIQFKEPGMTWGYIQFTLPGGIESRGGSWDAGSDENTVTFHADKLESFRKIRDITEEKQGLVAIPTTPQTAQTPIKPSIADELTKLATLKRDGAITEEEYEQLKRDLIAK